MRGLSKRWCGLALAALIGVGGWGGGGAYAAEEEPLQVEVESLFPMFFMGGYHLAVGLRQGQWRLRASCIDGGSYDYEPNNATFERNLGKGCGLFVGYFLSRGWHAYLFVERQEYIVTHRDTGVSATFPVVDIGPGVGYQYFFNQDAYLQPALHLYWRKQAQKTIDGIDYTLPATDLSAIVRLGYRF